MIKKFFNKLFTKNEVESSQKTLHLGPFFEQHVALQMVFDEEHGKIVEVNQALCTYYGGERADLIGKSVFDFSLVPREEFELKFVQEKKNGTEFLSTPHRLKNGEIKLLDVHASTIKYEGRKLVYAIMFDSDEHFEYRSQLHQEKEFLRTTLLSIDAGVITTDNFGVITNFNTGALKMTGWTKKEVLGKKYDECLIFVDSESGKPVEHPIAKIIENQGYTERSSKVDLVSREGVRTPVATTVAPIHSNAVRKLDNEEAQHFGIVLTFNDETAEREQAKKIEYMSYHDSLTGLYNRRYFDEKIQGMDQPGSLPMYVLVADVNGLKITNDVFGHEAGDKLLKKAAEVLQTFCREDDIVIRMGGDEFVVLMPGKTAQAVDWFITEVKHSKVENEDTNLPLSLSFGYACASGGKGTIFKALQQADKNMYQQKLLKNDSNMNVTITTLMKTLYEISSEARDHSDRMDNYCRLIGERLGMSPQELDELSIVATLHDIGKVGIDSSILAKPESLSTEEWLEVKRHSEIGYRIVKEMPGMTHVAEMILHHHERWDGGGYPRQISKTDIPLCSRIVAVVDAFDAMTNDRAYRKALPIEIAIAEIDANSGTQFDPDVAKVMVGVLKEEFELDEVVS